MYESTDSNPLRRFKFQTAAQKIFYQFLTSQPTSEEFREEMDRKWVARRTKRNSSHERKLDRRASDAWHRLLAERGLVKRSA